MQKSADLQCSGSRSCGRRTRLVARAHGSGGSERFSSEPCELLLQRCKRWPASSSACSCCRRRRAARSRCCRSMRRRSVRVQVWVGSSSRAHASCTATARRCSTAAGADGAIKVIHRAVIVIVIVIVRVVLLIIVVMMAVMVAAVEIVVVVLGPEARHAAVAAVRAPGHGRAPCSSECSIWRAVRRRATT